MAMLEFAGNLEEKRLLFPVRALFYYLCATKDLSSRHHTLLVPPHCPTRSLSMEDL